MGEASQDSWRRCQSFCFNRPTNPTEGATLILPLVNKRLWQCFCFKRPNCPLQVTSINPSSLPLTCSLSLSFSSAVMPYQALTGKLQCLFPRNIFQDFGASLVSGPVERHDALVANDGNHGLGTFTRAMAGRSRAWRGHLLLQQVYPYMTPQQHICISARKFNNGGVAGHSTREGHHVDGPWGTKGRHQHDSKRLQHSPGAIR